MTAMLTVRPAGPGDASDICALLNAVDVIEIGRPETDLGTVEADLHHPEVNLATDSWLAFQGGRLVAYALVWADSGPGRVDGDHYVLPGHPVAAMRGCCTSWRPGPAPWPPAPGEPGCGSSST